MGFAAQPSRWEQATSWTCTKRAGKAWTEQLIAQPTRRKTPSESVSWTNRSTMFHPAVTAFLPSTRRPRNRQASAGTRRRRSSSSEKTQGRRAKSLITTWLGSLTSAAWGMTRTCSFRRRRTLVMSSSVIFPLQTRTLCPIARAVLSIIAAVWTMMTTSVGTSSIKTTWCRVTDSPRLPTIFWHRMGLGRCKRRIVCWCRVRLRKTVLSSGVATTRLGERQPGFEMEPC